MAAGLTFAFYTPSTASEKKSMKKSFRANPDKLTSRIVFGTGMVVGGVMFNYPMEYSTDKVVASLAQFQDIWWIHPLVFLAAFGIAWPLYDKRPALSEWVASLGVMAVLFPALGLLAGLPNNIGISVGFIKLGWLVLIVTASTWVSANVLSVIQRKLKNANIL